MEELEIMVNEIYDNKESYKEIDYITIMNILKETYLRLTGDLGFSNSKLEHDDMCEYCEENDIYEDGYCYTCYEIGWEYQNANPYPNTDESDDDNLEYV